jgi:hypothetical protein
MKVVVSSRKLRKKNEKGEQSAMDFTFWGMCRSTCACGRMRVDEWLFLWTVTINGR